MASFRFVRYWVVIASLLLPGTSLAAAQDKDSVAAAEYKALLDKVGSLMDGPERSGIPWRVQVRKFPDKGPVSANPWSSDAPTGLVDIRNHEGPDRIRPIVPILWLSQRSPVYIYAVVPYTYFAWDSTDLYLFVQIRDLAGRPLYSTVSHPPVPTRPGYSVVWRAALWGRPGAYAASVVLYDAVTGQSSVWHGRFDLGELEKSEIPSLDTSGPQIALESDYAHQPVGGLIPPVPLTTPRAVQIDVVADFSETIGSGADYFAMQHTILAAFLMSRLQPARGCVRITAFNALRAQVLFDRVDEEAMNWNGLSRKISGTRLSRNTIDISALTAVQKGPAFLRDQMARILSDSRGCSGLQADPLHLVIVVAPGIRISPKSDFRFFEKVALDPAQLPEAGNYRLYYLQTDGYPSTDTDYLRNMLRPAHEDFLEAYSPGKLRRALVKIADEMNHLPAERK